MVEALNKYIGINVKVAVMKKFNAIASGNEPVQLPPCDTNLVRAVEVGIRRLVELSRVSSRITAWCRPR